MHLTCGCHTLWMGRHLALSNALANQFSPTMAKIIQVQMTHVDSVIGHYWKSDMGLVLWRYVTYAPDSTPPRQSWMNNNSSGDSLWGFPEAINRLLHWWNKFTFKYYFFDHFFSRKWYDVINIITEKCFGVKNVTYSKLSSSKLLTKIALFPFIV